MSDTHSKGRRSERSNVESSGIAQLRHQLLDYLPILGNCNTSLLDETGLVEFVLTEQTALPLR